MSPDRLEGGPATGTRPYGFTHGDPAPGSAGGHRVIGSVTLPAVPESVREARRYAQRLLPPGEPSETVVLLVSEAATNSVTHSDSRDGGKVTLVLYGLRGGGVRAEVIDDGGPTVPVRRDSGELSLGGRGVALIEALAVRSGWYWEDGRLHTWFEVE